MQPLDGPPRTLHQPGADPFAKPCACMQPKAPQKQQHSHAWYVGVTAVSLVLWFALYRVLQPAAHAIVGLIPGIEPESGLYEALTFFIYDTPKVLMLLALVIFVVGIIRTFFTPAATHRYLAGKHEGVGNVLAALLGIVTPFCSCSAVPLFLGFVATGVPLGVTFSFLIASPMINEIALALLWSMFGAKVALLYAATGLTIAIIAGWVLGRMNLEHLVEDWVRAARDAGGNGPEFADYRARMDYAMNEVRTIVGKTWPYILVGIGAGAGIHGFVPEGMLASFMGSGAWWAVPLSVLIGIPMYANAASVVPIIAVLLQKGAALGTVLAFMMSVVGLSLPEMLILRRVLKPKLIVIFASVVGVGILIVGYLFNMIL